MKEANKHFQIKGVLKGTGFFILYAVLMMVFQGVMTVLFMGVRALRGVRDAKAFGLFLLMAAIGGAVVSLVNRVLRTQEMASQTTTYLLWLFLMVYFFVVCRWFFRKLNAIGKEK